MNRSLGKVNGMCIDHIDTVVGESLCDVIYDTIHTVYIQLDKGYVALSECLG